MIRRLRARLAVKLMKLAIRLDLGAVIMLSEGISMTVQTFVLGLAQEQAESESKERSRSRHLN